MKLFSKHFLLSLALFPPVQNRKCSDMLHTRDEEAAGSPTVSGSDVHVKQNKLHFYCPVIQTHI